MTNVFIGYEARTDLLSKLGENSENLHLNPIKPTKFIKYTKSKFNLNPNAFFQTDINDARTHQTMIGAAYFVVMAMIVTCSLGQETTAHCLKVCQEKFDACMTQCYTFAECTRCTNKAEDCRADCDELK